MLPIYRAHSPGILVLVGWFLNLKQDTNPQYLK